MAWKQASTGSSVKEEEQKMTKRKRRNHSASFKATGSGGSGCDIPARTLKVADSLEHFDVDPNR